MQARRFILLTLGVTAIAACERGSTPAVDSVALATTPDVDAPWVPELGPLFAIHGDSGEATGASTIVRDVTLQREADERERQLLGAAAAANAKFHAFFEQGAFLAGIMDVDGTLLEANRLSWEST